MGQWRISNLRLGRANLTRRPDASWLQSLLAVALACLCGCRSVERSMVAVSRIKSPVTFNVPAVNSALTREELRQAGVDPGSMQPASSPVAGQATGPQVRYDDLADLSQSETVVLVCLSGGGSRAARLAAHTLALLEAAYNARLGSEAKLRPLMRQIDAWSTVSGGSLYASHVAMCFSRDRVDEGSFRRLATTPRSRLATQRLGAMATAFYFWPGYLGFAPIVQILTEWDTLNLFARTHAMLQEGRLPFLPISALFRLGQMPQRPRFFFNASCLETGGPMVFTQSIIHRHLAADPLARLSADPLVTWTRNGTLSAGEPSEPLRFAITLEDLGSSPTRFPLAYSVFASAAFPGVFQPLILQKFRPAQPRSGADPASAPLWEKEGVVTVVDGGLYDNTGITTALELFSYLETRGKPGKRGPRLVLLAIDAGVAPETYESPRIASKLPFRADFPIRGLVPAVSAFSRLHNKQQSLVRAAIGRQLDSLAGKGLIDYFDVRLINATNNARALRVIPTDFVITDREDAALKEAAVELLGRPKGGRSMADAFAEAVRSKAAPPK